MSGVYLIVSKFGNPEAQSFLATTTGGYPHITFFYSGRLLSRARLLELGQKVFSEIALAEVTISAKQAYVNKFFREKSGAWRYDVLIRADETTCVRVNWLRAQLLQDTKGLSTGPPHITHSIHWTQEDADAALADLQKRMGTEKTYSLEIAGYAIC